jgi:hypothetical protein
MPMTSSPARDALWPLLPLDGWRATYETLHLWTQIAGKIRLAQTPWQNHSWHVALYVSARGLTTSPIPFGARTLELEFDFCDHMLWLRTSDGHARQVMLKPQTTALFHGEVMAQLAHLGMEVRIDERPSEIADGIRYNEDHTHKSYDPDAARRLHKILVQCDRVFKQFRSGFLGKASPVHFFWGSFDLAVTRFSGRTAPRHPGGVPALPDAVACEAYSHEESSAGFWPGSGPIAEPAFYSYAYPAPQGFADAKVKPDAAYWSKDLGEFILPYEAVRTASDPDAVLLAFLQSTYDAAADLAKWDRKALECPLGRPGIPRVV